MLLRKPVFLTSTLIFLCAVTVAQISPSETNADKDKKKKEMDELVLHMLDQCVADVPGLRLAQNRAIVDAMAGDLYWKLNEKRSRELFRNAAGEIVTFNAETEKERAENTEPDYNIYDPNDPRNDVLQLIVKHEADLALEMLLQTRSPRLAEAIAKAAVNPSDGDLLSNTIDKARAAQEIALEQSFALRAANNDPDKLIKLIKDGIAKGVTVGLIGPLQSLNQKDSKKAIDLGADVVGKLADADMAKNQNDMLTALSYLQFASRPAPPTPDPKVKPLAFAAAQLKIIANKVVDALLLPAKSWQSMTMITAAIPTLEKYVPERVGLLRQRDGENKKSLPTEMKNQLDMQKMWNPGSTPEEILAQLAKMPGENEKRMGYSLLPGKIAQIPDEARAKKLIDQIPDEKTRGAAQEQFDAARIGRESAAGKVDDARRLIGTLTNRRIQIQQLVALATQIQKKGTEKDIETAKGMMADAKALTKDFPDDEDDLADEMEVIRGYAVIDPEIAFRMFEPMVDEFNNMVQASAVLSKYNKRDRTFKKGELVMRANGNFGNGVLLFRYIQQMQLLGKADLEHMSQLCDRFQRSDSRTIVKLFVLQGYMVEDKKPIPPGASTITTRTNF